MWAHSANVLGRRQLLSDHARSTAVLAARFAGEFGAGELGFALGLFHDAGKACRLWQEGLLRAEVHGGRVGVPHKELGANLLRGVAGAAAMAVHGHHGGLTSPGELRALDPGDAVRGRDEVEAFLGVLPEAEKVLTGAPTSLLPAGWRRGNTVAEMGVRLAFSALVDADHLDTAAHAKGRSGPRVRDDVDMAVLRDRFEAARRDRLAGRTGSPVDAVRERVYGQAVRCAGDAPGVFRLPAPTGSGKTWASAGFALHHAARYGKRRVIVAVPFITVTEQNAAEYRAMLGADAVLEHHSAVHVPESGAARWAARAAAENWDSPFVVTTTVQLFDSLFARTPSRMRKLHRLANAVIVLDEVQALPLRVLTPILDALRVLTEYFGVTVLLASATQPSFPEFDVWRGLRVRDIVENPRELFAAMRRVRYEWWLNPRPTLAEVGERACSHEQVLMVVNTTADARSVFQGWKESGAEGIFHLSTRMMPAHRRTVLDEVRERLSDGRPVRLVSTQLVEAGVDIDFPVVFRAFAPAEAVQQAAGRANREGTLGTDGLVVVFAARDMSSPAGYVLGSAVTAEFFGPRGDGMVRPDDVDALDRYYRTLYRRANAEYGTRAAEIQRNRKRLDFQSVAEGPERAMGEVNGRDPALAFRMLDDDTVPVAVTDHDGPTPAAALIARLRREPEQAGTVLRQLQPYLVALPKRLLQDPAIAALCEPVFGDLYEWTGPYDTDYGIDTTSGSEREVW
ncbi:CRISPR-associated helicase/endonuclease Cas3 [Amycolatopsis thailandensis]|uniref:CRISPR-associated helicase/endonuclease Cas3 n=2 Tax=Amycolatopsis thailandensis TaxID=589330 RepID=A0A229RV24_9PSEU|nr:CRISPR-associated helicase/endonuclease Cas3 [Amycolatopsis thailandensis]OXM50341.1 CRISPR-associated helicase/endonuclease Cas3 [Amycolatopsis thailandensis]